MRLGSRSRIIPIALACAFAMALSLIAIDRLFPPDLTRYQTLSKEVLDSEGRHLRLYLAGDGVYRMPVDVGDVDPRYIDMLIAFEDKRFYRHHGVDTLALARATRQALSNGRFVSGASTLTMQTARLLEPRKRTLGAKLIEMWRALQLERRYSKQEILSIYLTLAPFGGNLEGVRAASLHYLGQLPQELTLGEAAMLVALPQSPSWLRPDRHPERARAARDKVLARVEEVMQLPQTEWQLALSEPIAFEPQAFPFLAPHLGDRLINSDRTVQTFHTEIDRGLQLHLERLARDAAKALGPRQSIAILVVENKTRKVRAYVGASDFTDFARAGQVDMITAIRSPGSTLKSAIYGLAFERGLAHPATLVNDVPTQFGDYTPSNFMDRHYGEVSLASALRMSLNVPAVALLDELGPVSTVERLRRAGVTLKFGGSTETPGLAFALGGVGTRLEDLVSLYAAFADDGRVLPLELITPHRDKSDEEPLLGDAARWYLRRILEGVPPPGSLLPDRYRKATRGAAFKTGTSYGFRDAWALGYSSQMTIGVWVGRPDGTPSPGQFGANTAAPLLFQVIDHLPPAPPVQRVRPADALPLVPGNLPPGLRYLGRQHIPVAMGLQAAPPRILFPLNDTVLQMPPSGRGIVLEVEGGQRPYTWVVNGRPVGTAQWQRHTEWQPDGPGFSDIVLIDGSGQRASAKVRLILE